jgi:hypothetical protein
MLCALEPPERSPLVPVYPTPCLPVLSPCSLSGSPLDKRAAAREAADAALQEVHPHKVCLR